MSTYRPPNRPDDQEWPPKQRPNQSPQEPPYSGRRDFSPPNLTPGRPPAEEGFSPYRPDQQTRVADRQGSPFPDHTPQPPDPPRAAEVEVPPVMPVVPTGRPEHSLADLRLPPSAKLRLFTRPAKQGGRDGWLTLLLVLLALAIAGAALGLSLRKPEDNTRDEVLKVLTEQGGTAQAQLATISLTETQAAFESMRTQTMIAMTNTAAAQAVIPPATFTPNIIWTPSPDQTQLAHQGTLQAAQTQGAAAAQAEEDITAEAPESSVPTATLNLPEIEVEDASVGEQVGIAPTKTTSPTSTATSKPTTTPPPTLTTTMEPTQAVVVLGKVNATISSVNVRSGPGTRYGIVEKIANRSEIQILGHNDGQNYFNNLGENFQNWYKIKAICATGTQQECNEYEGWIAREFVQLDDEAQSEQIPVLLVGVDYPPA